MVRLTWLTGSVAFVPPKYRAVLKQDGRWWLECDTGVCVGGFADRIELMLAARSSGIKVETP